MTSRAALVVLCAGLVMSGAPPATPAPATPAPDTALPAGKSLAPDTPAPSTPAPATTAPATPAPDTALPAGKSFAPDTPAPPTPAPATTAPATPAPATPAPNTPLPPGQSFAPDTSAPPTPAPATPAPNTPLPPGQTFAPDTPAPATPAPATPAPATPAPPTIAPTSAPATPAPATSAPDTPLPPGMTSAPATPSSTCGVLQCDAVRAELQRRGEVLASALTANPYIVALHKPSLTIANGIATVVVGADAGNITDTNGYPGLPVIHPMSGTTPDRDPFASHFVDGIFVLDADKKTVAVTGNLYPTVDDAPAFSFVIPKGVTQLTPYSSCNVHGVFQGTPVDVVPADINNVMAAAVPECVPAGCTRSALEVGDSLLSVWRMQGLKAYDSAKNPLYSVSNDPDFQGKHRPVFTNYSASSSLVSVVIGEETPNNATHLGKVSGNPAEVHYIDSIIVVDQDDKVVAFGIFPPAAESPTLTFSVPNGVSSMSAYAHCSKHGLFAATSDLTEFMTVAPTAAEMPPAQCYTACQQSTPIAGAVDTTKVDPALPVYGRMAVGTVACLDLGISRPVSSVEFAKSSGVIATTEKFVIEFSTAYGACDEVTAYTKCFENGPLATPFPADTNIVSAKITAVALECQQARCIRITTTKPAADVFDSAAARGVQKFVPDGGNQCLMSALAADAMRLQVVEWGNLVHLASEQKTDKEILSFIKHTPVIVVSGPEATIAVGNDSFPWSTALTYRHPMDADHYIDTVYAVDEMDRVVATGFLTPSLDAPATYSFTIPKGVKKLTPFAHCNTHGLYKGDTVVVESATSLLPMADVLSSGCVYTRCAGVSQGRSPVSENMTITCDALRADSKRKDESHKVDIAAWKDVGSSEFTAMHLPRIDPHADAGMYVVTLPKHPYVQGAKDSRDPFAAHFIDFIWVEDAATGVVVASAVTSPMQSAELVFHAPKGTVSVKAFAHCNLHGVFSTDSYTVVPSEMVHDHEGMLEQCLDVATFPPRNPTGVKHVSDTPCKALVTEVMRLNDAPTPPNPVDDFTKKHTPYVTVANTTVTVTIGVPGIYHPMVASNTTVHFIDTVWLVMADENGKEWNVALWSPSPSMAVPVIFETQLPTWAAKITAYAHCNIHGLFSSSITTWDSTATPATRNQNDPNNACAVESCLAAASQDDCNALWADAILRGSEVGKYGISAPAPAAAVPSLTLRSGATSTLGYAVLTIKPDSGEARPYINSPGAYVKQMFVVADDTNVVAAGVFSPTEPYSTMEFSVPTGVSQLKLVVLISSQGLVEGQPVSTDGMVLAGDASACKVAKCLLTRKTSPLDFGLQSMPAMVIDSGRPVTPQPGGSTTVSPGAVSAAPETPGPRGAAEDDDGTPTTTIILAVVGGIVFLLLVGGGFFMYSRSQSKPPQMSFLEQCELLEGEKEDPGEVAV